MSANNGIIKNAQMRWQRREHNDRMTGYCYIGPDETHEPAQRRDSTISFENVIDGKRTRGSMETPEPSFVKPQRRKSRLSLRSEHKLEETVSSTPRSQSAKSVKLKQNSGRISQSRAVRPIFPNLPRAKNRPDEHLKAESNQSDKKIQRLESVNLTSVSSWPQEEQKNNFTASDCPISEDGGDRNKLSRLARDLAQKQEEAKLYTKEIRILKRQVQLLLAHSDEMADLKIDLGDVRAQNEELQRQINEPRGSTRRASKVQNEDFEELQAQARTIQQLKSRLDKASQMNELIYKPSLYCWARKPADSKGGLMKIRTSVILLASSLEEILLTPKDLERSLELHGNGQATMDLLKKSFGNIQLLFTEPWLALRSLLFRFIRDYIFYSDLWQTLHCDGFIAREYQRVIGLSAPDGYLELFHKTAFDEILHDTDFKEYVLKPHRQDMREELMFFLSPLIDPARLNEEIKAIESQADTLIEYAFSLRALCIPESGERFEITHYKPGDLFDPETMRPESVDGQEIHVPEAHDTVYHVKVCVHGSMRKYLVEENAKGVDSLKIIGQPFLDYSKGYDSRGSLVSEKACVVLDI